MTAEPSAISVTGTTALETTKRVLGKMMRREPDTIKDDAKLFAGLGLKSADVLDLLMLVEDDLGMRVDPAELEPRHLETVGSLSRFVAEQAGA